jgi:hypothetical protein
MKRGKQEEVSYRGVHKLKKQGRQLSITLKTKYLNPEKQLIYKPCTRDFFTVFLWFQQIMLPIKYPHVLLMIFRE